MKSLIVLLCEAERWRFVHEAVLYLDRLGEWLDTSLSPTCTLTPLTVPRCPKAAAPLMSTPDNLESGGGVVPDCSQQSSVCTMDTHDFHWLSQQGNIDNNGIQTNMDIDINTIIKIRIIIIIIIKKWSVSFWKPLEATTYFMLFSFPTWTKTVLQPLSPNVTL